MGQVTTRTRLTSRGRFAVSPLNQSAYDNMGLNTSRTNQTSRGIFIFSPWIDSTKKYSYAQLLIGSNPIGSLEIVSALNSFNLGSHQYHYNIYNCVVKYNPKVYLGTIQTASTNWNADLQKDQKNSLGNLPGEAQKSGSWPLLINLIYEILI